MEVTPSPPRRNRFNLTIIGEESRVSPDMEMEEQEQEMEQELEQRSAEEVTRSVLQHL